MNNRKSTWQAGSVWENENDRHRERDAGKCVDTNPGVQARRGQYNPFLIYAKDDWSQL